MPVHAGIDMVLQELENAVPINSISSYSLVNEDAQDLPVLLVSLFLI